MKNFPFQRAALATALTLLLAACAIPAKLGHPNLRDDVPLAGLESAARDGWPATDWWRAYGDPQLDQLIAIAMQKSPDLEQAHSRVINAEQSVRLAAAQAGLNVNGNAQFERQRLSENGIISLLPKNIGIDPWYNQSDLGLQAKYTFDWWGKKRSSIEAALDQAHAAEAQRSAAALTIQNAVADTYFGWQGDQARLALSTQLVSAQERFVHIAELRVAQGVDLADTAQQAKTQLAAAREMHVTLQGSAAIRKVALASLLGIAPADLPVLQPRPLPEVDSRIPANARLDLIARRPDIAASRWQVEAALKQTDVARAQYFPDIGISAMAGLSSIDLGKLLEAGSRTFALTPALHLPIFEGGQLKANYGVSKAQLAAAVAQYNSTVVGAAREVATQALTAQQIAARRKEQSAQITANERLLATAQARAHQGVRDAREGLAAAAQLIQQQDDAASLHAQAVSTDLALIKALGGGYQATGESDNASPTPPSLANPSGDDAHERH
ncbi:multidrug resistance outer membrane protein MdtP [Rhodanobacter panaciterrae]|uniref:Multidrug resistance outer membrane protein MdtP n=1 Tax=Rhodanobacter panaciterrae TaxID=490572 RepID=A0ABQ2ZNC3_9GAMM|nr:efflux transporter outer membrane subunit [Rhodanobacter panaciterrae]GGY18594.1 multidrug resistance outer membrane protein MdtP [Rhodanobacter panaciterrae]